MTTNEISNVNSVVADLAPGLDLASALVSAGAISVAPATQLGDALAKAGKRKGKQAPVTHKPVEPAQTILPQAGTPATVGPVEVPEGAPVTIQLPMDDVITAGVTSLASAIAADLYAGSNIFVGLAKFGEESGLAGKRTAAEACLRLIASEPDRFIPAGVSPNVRHRVLRMCDKGLPGAAAEFSRAASAITAGSVLTYYLDKARALFDANPAATGWSRVVQRLTSATMAEARTALGAPVADDWAGLPEATVCLPTILAAAASTEKQSQDKINAARAAGAGNPPAPPAINPPAQGSAGRTSNGTSHAPKPENPALAPAAAQAEADKAAAPPAVVPSTGPSVKPHVGKLQSIQGVALSLQGDAPDTIRKSVVDQVEVIIRALDTIRSLFNQAATAPATANPANGLSILAGFDGFKIG